MTMFVVKSIHIQYVQVMALFMFVQKDFFQLKELERQCQKEKGITSMSVKEILTSLVDDGMVDTDKIGTSVYFWAFPSKASQNVHNTGNTCRILYSYDDDNFMLLVFSYHIFLTI